MLSKPQIANVVFIENNFDSEQLDTVLSINETLVSAESNYYHIFNDGWHPLQMQALSICANLGMNLGLHVSSNPSNFENESGLWNYDTELTTIIKEALVFKLEKVNSLNERFGYPTISISTITNKVVLDRKEALLNEFQASSV